jgi:hypothetical protein
MGAACRNGRLESHADDTLEATPTLDEAYGRLRSGALNLASADGQWTFGLALLKSSGTF